MKLEALWLRKQSCIHIGTNRRTLNIKEDYLKIPSDAISIVNKNVALAYLDTATMYLTRFEHNSLNQIVNILFNVLYHDSNLEDAKNNILYCINKVNMFFKVKTSSITDNYKFNNLYHCILFIDNLKPQSFVQ